MATLTPNTNIVAGITDDIHLEIARGNVPGVSGINKFGANLVVTADTKEDAWDGGGTYSFPTTADMTHLRQAVDQIAMRGGTIEVQGLDINWLIVTQNITLDASNTTTPVALGTPLLRVIRMKVFENIITDQNIELRNVGGGTTYSIIQSGKNQTLMAIYSTPINVEAYITSYYLSQIDATTKTPTATIGELWIADRGNNYEFQIKHAQGIPEAGDGFIHRFNPYLKMPQQCDIKMSVTPTDQDGSVYAGFDIILVNK